MDYVIKILSDYLAWERRAQAIGYNRLPQIQKDEFRLKNDNDAKYYYEKVGLKRDDALKGDTIVSFWTPYKRLLELEAGWSSFKKEKSLERLLEQSQTARENDYTPKIKQVNRNVEFFAKICYTKGNYMLLPERGMNTQRYCITQDRIDMTLYECFDKGALAKFFSTEDDLYSWIRREKLDVIFVDGKLSRENVKWFTSRRDKPIWISEMSVDEVYEYLENAISLIEWRNKD